MGFILVRLDAEEPIKIPLEIGTHIIGRGSFLNCDDQRVSRKHGVIKVTERAVLLKSLSQNPCFYNKSLMNKTVVLPQGKTVQLSCTDHIGLLPSTYWYELIYCDVSNIEQASRALSAYNNLDYLTHDSQDDSEALNLQFDETMEVDEGVESQSLLTGIPEAPKTNPLEDSNTIPLGLNTTPPRNQAKDDETYCVQTSLGKRSHSPEPDNGIKKVKNEPLSPKVENPEENVKPHCKSEPDDPPSPIYENLSQSPIKQNIDQQNTSSQNPDTTNEQAKDTTDAESAYEGDTDPPSPEASCKVKKEPEDPETKDPATAKDGNTGPGLDNPGPSHDQPGSSNDDGAPAKPPNPPLRERCIYGANCYRKNPQHKAQFSHPSDADYGPGPTPPCPRGAACRRRDPRHWVQHSHPPGTARPPHQGIRMLQRHGQIFYINARTVNFYDDHYSLEDEDGDSVDYDYEF